MIKNKLYYKYLPLKRKKDILTIEVIKRIKKGQRNDLIPFAEKEIKSVRFSLNKRNWLVIRGKTFKIEFSKTKYGKSEKNENISSNL